MVYEASALPRDDGSCTDFLYGLRSAHANCFFHRVVLLSLGPCLYKTSTPKMVGLPGVFLFTHASKSLSNSCKKQNVLTIGKSRRFIRSEEKPAAAAAHHWKGYTRKRLWRRRSLDSYYGVDDW